MKLTLKRVALKEHYTIGKLYIDGKYFCDTLEDTVRDLKPDGSGKVYGETAIPAGTYSIEFKMSPHFKKSMPYLVDVPFFEGIMIHPGNKPIDTLGCILVGVNDVQGMITKSVKTWTELMLRIAGKDLSIEIL